MRLERPSLGCVLGCRSPSTPARAEAARPRLNRVFFLTITRYNSLLLLRLGVAVLDCVTC